MFYNIIFVIIALTILYLTYIKVFLPLLKKGQAEVDILPTSEYCDSMGELFKSKTDIFAKFAKSDYDLLANAFGKDKTWDLTDPTKKEQVSEVKGGLVCFCTMLNEIDASKLKQVNEIKKFKQDDFVKIGCKKISEFQFDALLFGLKITVTILILNAVM